MTGSSPHRPLRLAVALAAVVLLVGCGTAGSPPSAGPEPARIRLAYQPGPASLPLEYADRSGIFARNGLRVERTEGQDITVFATALSQGTYEIAMTVPTIVLVGAEKGLNMQIVSSLQRSSQANPNLAWITKDPSITSLEQLKGKTVAVPSLVGLVTDSFAFLLERRGVSRKDVRFVQLAGSAMADQLKAGRVDAAVHGMNTGSALAVRNGFTVHTDVVAQAVEEASGGTARDAITLLFAATPEYTKRHPDLIRSFRASLAAAIDHLTSHDEEARGLLQEWLKFNSETARSVTMPTWRVEIEPAELAPYVTISKAVGTITEDTDLERLVWQDRP